MRFLFQSSINFFRHVVGLVTKPYPTYREITTHPKSFDVLYLVLICFGYFGLASLLRVSSFHLNLLTKEFILLCVGFLIGFGVMVSSVFFIGKVIGGRGIFMSVVTGWGYTFIPTVLWFLCTSILFVLFPPPRTESIKGVAFSVLYLIVSSVLLFWKIELYYLTLRFGLKLTLPKIAVTSCVMIPIIIFYTISMYKLGIFRVPFI